MMMDATISFINSEVDKLKNITLALSAEVSKSLNSKIRDISYSLTDILKLCQSLNGIINEDLSIEKLKEIKHSLGEAYLANSNMKDILRINMEQICINYEEHPNEILTYSYAFQLNRQMQIVGAAVSKLVLGIWNE